MKERLKNGITAIKQRTRFVQGFVAGLFIMSALTYAAVTFNTFTANTPISSDDMNTNFATIKTKLDSLEVGFEASLSAPFQLSACGIAYSPAAGDYEVIVGDVVTRSDGNYNTSDGSYTFADTAIYKFYLEGTDTLNASSDYRLQIEVFNGTAWVAEQIQDKSSIVRKFSMGDKIRVSAACGNKYPSAATNPAIVDRTKFVFALKKF